MSEVTREHYRDREERLSRSLDKARARIDDDDARVDGVQAVRESALEYLESTLRKAEKTLCRLDIGSIAGSPSVIKRAVEADRAVELRGLALADIEHARVLLGFATSEE